jgi:hypothetical protein
MEPPPSSPAPVTARRWLPFFLLLAVAAAIAVVVPIVFNLRQQLTPEELDGARELWRSKAPPDYDLTYTIRYDLDTHPVRYLVQVRGGEVVLVISEGEMLVLDPWAGFALGPCARVFGQENAAAYGIEGVFARIEKALAENAAASRRNFTTALFDARTGHPVRFVHRIRGTSKREEWKLELRLVP